MTNRIASLIAVGTILLATFGCNSGPKIVPTKGIVQLEDGKVLGKIMVEFHPVGGGPRSYGETNEAGEFDLSTDDGVKGAVVGDHKVILRDVGNVPKFIGRRSETENASDGTPPRIAGKYTLLDKSGLTATVKAGDGPITFKVTAK